MTSISKSRNKQNVPELKKEIKQIKTLRSHPIRQCCPLKNQLLKYPNHSLDASEITVKSSRKKSQLKSKIRPRYLSENELKPEKKAKKIIPLNLDSTFFKRPLSEKSLKQKNNRKQSEYVSYLIQAQRKAMNSLSSMDNSMLNNCHEIQKISFTELTQLRQDMEGLKNRFQRLESEQNQKQPCQRPTDHNKKTVLQDITNKNSVSQSEKICTQIKDSSLISDKYSNIIKQYEKMFLFYKERLQVFQNQVQNQKCKLKQVQELNKHMQSQLKQGHDVLRKISKQNSLKESRKDNEVSQLRQQVRKKERDLSVQREELIIRGRQIKILEQTVSKTNQKVKQQENQLKQEKYLLEESLAENLKLNQVYEDKICIIKLQNEANIKNLSIWNNQLVIKIQRLQMTSKQDREKDENAQLQLQQRIAHMANETSSKQCHLQSVSQKIAVLIVQKQKITFQSQNYQNQIQVLTQTICSKQSEISALSSRLVEVSLASSNCSALNSKQITLVKEELSGSLQKIQEKQKQMHQLKKLLNQFKLEVENIRQDLLENQRYIEDLQKSKQELLNQHSDQQKSEHQTKQEMQKVHQKLTCELEQKSILQKEKSELITANLMLLRQNQTLKTLKQQLIQAKYTISTEKSSILAEKSSIMTERQQLITQIQKLNQIIKQKTQKIEELNQNLLAQNRQKQNFVTLLEEEISGIKLQKTLLKNEISQKSCQITSLRQQIIDLSEQGQLKLASIKQKHQIKLINWKSQIDAVKKQIEQKNSEIQALKQKLIQESQKLTKSTQIIQKLHQKVQDQEQRYKRVRNELNEANTIVSNMKIQNKQCSQQLQSVTEQLSSLTNRYEESQTSYRQLNQQKSQQITSIYQICQEEKRENIEKMRNKIDELIDEIKYLEHQLQSKQNHLSIFQGQKQANHSLRLQVQDLQRKLFQGSASIKLKQNEILKVHANNQEIYKKNEQNLETIRTLTETIRQKQDELKSKNAQTCHQKCLSSRLESQLAQSKENISSLVQKISILKEQNQAIISTCNHQLDQRRQIIEDLMKQKKILYYKLNGQSSRLSTEIGHQ